MNMPVILYGFLLNERIFNLVINDFIEDQINSYNTDIFLFLSETRSNEKILEIIDDFIEQLKSAYTSQKETYNKNFDEYLKLYRVEQLLLDKIKDIVFDKNIEQLKYIQHKTKMSITNLVLHDILIDLNDKDIKQTDYSDPNALSENKRNT